jgi:putative sporulation protein YyaC
MKQQISIHSVDCQQMISEKLKMALSCVTKAYDEICVACIGTDRSTGDSLGPLVGHMLNDTGIKVVGTLDQPLHARNLEEFTSTLSDKTLVVAVDACLGSFNSVGTIKIKNEPLKPGSGLNKDLPPVGDVSVIGIVNQSGWMDFMVLQNTRLGLVMKMAMAIAEGLKCALLPSSLERERVSACAKN